MNDKKDISSDNQFIIDETKDGIIKITRNNKIITKLYTNEGFRPFLMPLMDPYGNPITREYPIIKKEGGSTDHIHHRSLWSAWGDIDGVNHWDEGSKGKKQIVKNITIINDDPALLHLKLDVEWNGNDDKPPIIHEIRDILIYNIKDNPETIIDYRSTYTAINGDIHFNDTKEAGLISVRVADSLREKEGGIITNAKGRKHEIWCWGRKSKWCDYSGSLNGNDVGITIMDHPDNPGYPTRWHVRGYGLMAANPFSLKCFKFILPEKIFTLKDKQSIQMKYRIYIHKNLGEKKSIERQYQDFIKSL